MCLSRWLRGPGSARPCREGMVVLSAPSGPPLPKPSSRLTKGHGTTPRWSSSTGSSSCSSRVESSRRGLQPPQRLGCRTAGGHRPIRAGAWSQADDKGTEHRGGRGPAADDGYRASAGNEKRCSTSWDQQRCASASGRASRCLSRRGTNKERELLCQAPGTKVRGAE
jgi:hypothetical protein